MSSSAIYDGTRGWQNFQTDKAADNACRGALFNQFYSTASERELPLFKKSYLTDVSSAEQFFERLPTFCKWARCARRAVPGTFPSFNHFLGITCVKPTGIFRSYWLSMIGQVCMFRLLLTSLLCIVYVVFSKHFPSTLCKFRVFSSMNNFNRVNVNWFTFIYSIVSKVRECMEVLRNAANKLLRIKYYYLSGLWKFQYCLCGQKSLFHRVILRSNIVCAPKRNLKVVLAKTIFNGFRKVHEESF